MIRDPRLTLARPDLASQALEGAVRAARFAPSTPFQVIAPVSAIRASADPDAEVCDQLLFGEVVEVIDTTEPFAWGQARRDGYVGHIAVAALSAKLRAPTHWVTALRTFAFAEPTIRARPFGPLSLNALVTIIEESETMVRAEGAGWIARSHLLPIGRTLDDPAAVAEGFVGTPYLWGGRDSVGLDCSGLIQQALYACGRACPRDTDQQARLGRDAPADGLVRGDLVFWPGHVAMMIDEHRLIHANAHHMAVAIEPLRQATSRIAAAGVGEPTAFRRI